MRPALVVDGGLRTGSLVGLGARLERVEGEDVHEGDRSGERGPRDAAQDAPAPEPALEPIEAPHQSLDLGATHLGGYSFGGLLMGVSPSRIAENSRMLKKVQMRGGPDGSTRGVVALGECGDMSGPAKRQFVGPIVSRVTWHGGRGRNEQMGLFSILLNTSSRSPKSN